MPDWTNVGEWLPWALVGAGLVVLGGVFLTAWLARLRGQGGGTGARSGAGGGGGERSRESMVEVKRLADQVAATLDAKAEELVRLIRDADERIATLRRMNQAQPPPRTAAAAAARATPRAEDGFEDPDPMNQQIYQLADEGLTAVEIAQRLGQHTGKVELILALRR